VYGQLAGAYYGERAIPSRWLSKLAHKDLIIEMADNLLILSENTEKSMDLEEPELIENIKLTLNPKVSYWVLFSNGTVIIFDRLTKHENIKEKAIKHMKEFGACMVTISGC
jgi:hypothetical protein